MNWTTGPLDPVVYWRRRALVGVPILILLLILATCAVKAAGSGDDTTEPGKDKAAAKSEKQPDESTPAPVTLAPPAVAPNPAPAQQPQPCGDNDLSVTVALAHQRYPTSSRLPVKVSVTNTSGKACIRDVGAVQQEVLVKGIGDVRIWSSDDCTNDAGADSRALEPNEKRTYWVTWDSRTSAPGCASTSSGSAKPGVYQVSARFGTKFSAPITVNLT